MKKTLILFCLLLSIQLSFCQTADVNAMLQKVAAEKDEDARFDIMLNFFSNTSESDPLGDIKNAEKLLIQSQKNNDEIGEVFATAEMGYDFRAFGNTSKSLEYDLKAVALAEETDNDKLIAHTKARLGNNYKDLANYPKAIGYYFEVIKVAEKQKYYQALTWAYQNLSEVYIAMNKMDSALKYAQMDYDLSMKIHYYNYLGYTLENLGAIHGKMGDAALAISYYDRAIQEGFKTGSAKQLNWAYTLKAEYYHDTHQADSSLAYAKKAIAVVQNTPFVNYSVMPARLLLDAYENSNSDSAIKYFKIYRAANDSLFSIKTVQQTQLMTFEEDLRQKEAAEEIMKVEEERRRNLQFAGIAFGIITLVILYLLFRRTLIANPKVIKILGVVGLLIVFEFFNLLLHPFIENITGHSPVLMLLALVCIAAVLVPMHHRLEKWATEKLVEKNTKLRLEAVKTSDEKRD